MEPRNQGQPDSSNKGFDKSVDERNKLSHSSEMSLENAQSPAEKLNELARCIEEGAEHPDVEADRLEKDFSMNPSGENRQKTRETIQSFVHAYRYKPEDVTDVTWLEREFGKYPLIWKNEDERKKAAQTIVEQVKKFEAEKARLAGYKAKGLTRESYLRSVIETGAKAQGVTSTGQYAAEIDRALKQANEGNFNLMTRKDGGINQQLHLDGFIAEQHHADTFNMEAAAQGKPYRAEVLKPAPGGTYGKNSVDIVIRDTRNGEIVRRYQAKYGKDAESTRILFGKGDYRGQQKLVPEGQGKDVLKSTETIEHDGIQSMPLSKEEAKERQRKMQEEQDARQYDWNEVNSWAIAKNIAQNASFSALLAAGFQGARIIGRRIWNSLTGKPNQAIEEDVAEFAKSAIKSGVGAGLTVAVTGGITVAVKRGLLGAVLKSTPVGYIANAVCIGIENANTLYEYASGKISGEEALDKAGAATCSLVGSLAMGVEGVNIGAAIGTVLGPVGTVVGGLAGGIVGGIAGGAIGKAIHEGGKAIAKSVADTVRVAAKGVKEGVKSIGRAVVSLFN